MIRVQRLGKRFGEVRAVDGLSFDVPPGAVTGFLGPNGAGKTTTLRMILGLVAPTEGAATINGSRYADLPNPSRTVGAVLDRSGFHPARTCRDHLRLYARMGGYPDARVAEVLDLVGATSYAHRRARGLSTGMRQRLNLATALLGDPQVLLLDEPSNGLDPEGIAWLRRFVRALAGEGRTLLVSSHVLSEAEQMVDRVVIIREGRLVTSGAIAELTEHGSLEQTYLTLTGGAA
ncbi:ABC transporter domain-containing protein [Kibdelosporangium persicum]|uniref:Daunorubicin/doxorubicin resistance ATP-binding protein DrrA n=1 Tax=Kibdelosporangium persicum TaxID=2698649 RepID=A0ABX2F5Z2_9PSEU|nr:Daunorubicin/doxorubicin resistance ATP-binding protein DrrA [Kibdelosporangium persicum]